jgi:hypothetical protein
VAVLVAIGIKDRHAEAGRLKCEGPLMEFRAVLSARDFSIHLTPRTQRPLKTPECESCRKGGPHSTALRVCLGADSQPCSQHLFLETIRPSSGHQLLVRKAPPMTIFCAVHIDRPKGQFVSDA